jgi:hypothetical protein
MAAPGGHTIEAQLSWNFEYMHAIEDLRSALEYGAYDAYERFVCSNHQPTTVHWNVSFPVAASPAAFQEIMTPIKKARVWNFRERGAMITDVFRSAQPFSAPCDSWLRDLHDLWNEGKHRNLNYFGIRLRVEPNPVPGTVWPILVRQELVISRTSRSLKDFFDVATREAGRVVADLGKALYP